MYGTSSEEVKVKVPAHKAWALYGTLELGKILVGKAFEAVDVVEGDGGVGTIIKLTFKQGSSFPYYKEKFTKVDNVNMIKVAEVVEGGYLDMGFTLYRITLDIKENDESSCILKFTMEYNVKEELVDKAPRITIEALHGVVTVANEHFLKSN